MSLNIHNLHISIDDKEIVHGLDIQIKQGEVHAIMGPNGSGKSTLANTLMGHPKYIVTQGEILLDGEDITRMKSDKRAKRGLFLSQQYLPAIEGVTVSSFLRTAVGALTGERQHPITFYKKILETMKTLGIEESFANRYVNVGFSGGEKKKMDVLQLLVLNPRFAFLDETDSGLDVDALKIVAEGIKRFHTPEKGIVLITHYQRILRYIEPDHVHIMIGGNMVKSGGKELAEVVERDGYEQFVK